MVAVVGWDILTSETQAEHAAEEKIDAYLMTLSDFWPGIRDRIGLPLPGNQNTAPTTMFNPDGSTQVGVFEVIGHDIEDASFTQWHPGNVILLSRVEG